MAYRYGEVEQALVEQFRVAPDRLGAFRARIRHFRTLGVPSVEKVGSGSKGEYSRLHVVQLSLALRLGEMGVAPRMAAAIALLRWVREALDAIDQFGSTIFVVHVVSNPFTSDSTDDDDGYTQFAYGSAALLRKIEEIGDAIVVDLSRLVKRLSAALRN